MSQGHSTTGLKDLLHNQKSQFADLLKFGGGSDAKLTREKLEQK